MTSQRQRAERFRDLHQGPGMLVLPNPWDAGSAKMLASLGFDALATTSAGLAFSLGRRDAEGAVSRTEALENARAIVAATDLPVAADLEKRLRRCSARLRHDHPPGRRGRSGRWFHRGCQRARRTAHL